MLQKKFNPNRINPKKESTFGAKKPFKGKNKSRSGRLKKSAATRNPLILEDYYRHVRDMANMTGCDAHHWMPKSKLKQDIFLTLVPVSEHQEIHAIGNNQSPTQWAIEKGYNVLVEESMTYFYEWAVENDLPSEYFELINDLKDNPLNAHDMARDFIFNNRGL